MSVSVVVPPLGNEGQPLRVSLWFVEVGQSVLAGDRLVELMLPGMTFDVPSPCTGTLTAIIAREGTEIAEGDELGTIRPE